MLSEDVGRAGAETLIDGRYWRRRRRKYRTLEWRTDNEGMCVNTRIHLLLYLSMALVLRRFEFFTEREREQGACIYTGIKDMNRI
jgi:hypothetical protein